MKRVLFILVIVLLILYIALSLLSRVLDKEYAAEKLFHRAAKTGAKIAINPDVVPPKMSASVERDLQRILDKYPETKTARLAQMALAKFHIANKKYNKAILVLDAIINKYEDAAMLSNAHFLKGSVYEKQNQWNKALKEYTILKNKYKDTSLGLQIPLYIGDYYTREGKDVEADNAYNEAVVLYEKIKGEGEGKPLGYMASTLLAQTYMNLKKYEEAGKIIEDTINNYPSQLTYMQHLRSVEPVFVKHLNRPEKAIEIYNSIKEKTNDDNLKQFLEKKIGSLKPSTEQKVIKEVK